MIAESESTVKEYKILMLSHRYDVFVKETVEAVSRHVNQINVLIHHNKLAEFSNYVPLGGYLEHVKKFTKTNLLNLNEKPNNVNINLVPVTYFIPDGSNKKLGDKIAAKFEKFIKKENVDFDIIHAHFTWPCGYVGVKLKEKFDVPLVITANGYDVYDMPFRSKNWKEKIVWTLNHADHVIAVSNSIKKISSQKLDVEDEKISVIPNGFNGKKFYLQEKKEARKKLGLPKNKKIILNVANLVTVKEQKCLIEAIRKISKRKRDILCIIVGSGELKKDLENKIKRSNSGDYIKLAGAKPHEEIPLWMNAADVFVLPSLNEGNPTVMFEALGVGLPFVGTKVGGIPEVITSGDYGLLVEPMNSEDLAEKILIALNKEWNREKILKYAEQFTWENIAKETVEIYEKVIRNKNQ